MSENVNVFVKEIKFFVANLLENILFRLLTLSRE